MKIVTIKQASRYIPKISRWLHSEFVVPYTDEISEMAFINMFQSTSCESIPITWVAVDDDECMGTVTVKENDFRVHPEYTPWLSSLYVHPSFRSNGIAERLMIQAEEHTANHGFNKIYLRTETASAYYEQRNWEFVFEEFDPGIGRNTRVYKKKL